MFPPCFFFTVLAADVTEGDDRRIIPAAVGAGEQALGFIEDGTDERSRMCREICRTRSTPISVMKWNIGSIS